MTQSLYQDHFKIRENPFSILPDPHYLYMSQRHQEALAHLAYGISSQGGFVLLTGEVGTGKTTICRALIKHLPKDADLALILNPKLSEPELLGAICDEMNIAYAPGTTSLKTFFDLINVHLLNAHAKGRNPVLMIDEAQNLTNNVLEIIRLLTNLETSEKKLLQIILVGQPELNQILAHPNQRQTAQRITARYHLMPLEIHECHNYIAHRLNVAGLESHVFTPAAIKSIHKAARGIPRLINSICDRALLAAYVEGRQQVSKPLAEAAAKEVFGTQAIPTKSSQWGALTIVLVVLGLTIWVGMDPFHTGIKNTLMQFSLSEKSPVDMPPKDIKPGNIKQQPVLKKSSLSPPKSGQDISKPAGTVIEDLIQAATSDIAFQHLFSQWGQDYLDLPGLNPCIKAKSAGILCAQGETDLKGLKAMNRPVVTSFVMPDGEHIYGMITSISPAPSGSSHEDQISITFSNRILTMPASAFLLRWPKDYLVLWKPFAPIKRPLVFGQQGNDVQELRRLLALAGYKDGSKDATGQGSGFFGPSLREKIRKFQNDFGLQTDGVVTPNTLMFITGLAKTTAVRPLHQQKG